MAQQLKQEAADLEQALLVLPFDYVVRLVKVLIELSKREYDLELVEPRSSC